MRRALLTAALLGALAGPAAAQDDEFAAAANLMAADRDDEAARAFVALADAHPGTRQAAEALFTAAQLYEEKLGDPVRAQALYERLVRDLPDSRPALAAGRRAAALRADLGGDGSGAAALARFTDALQRYPERGEAATSALVEQILVEFPGWAGAPRGLLWLADADRRAGRLAAAEARYLETAARWPGAVQELEAWRGAGDTALAQGAFARATAHYQRMRATGRPGVEATYAYALVTVRRERLRAAAYQAAFAAAAVALLGLLALARQASGSWRATAAAVVRPPIEAIYFAPVGALLIIAALTGHEQIAPATALIAAAGLLFTWLSGAGLEAARRRRGRPRLSRTLLSAVLACAGVAAACYIALHRTRLLDLVLTTVRFGPDR